MTLEKLLNILCEKGWKPFGESRINEINRAEQYVWNWNWCCWGSKDAIQRRKSTRQLVSKESGLWQFVCEMSAYNNYNKEKWKVLTWKKFEDDKYQINWYSNWWWYIQDYEYRLIESALCDEDKLEEFLLSNIVIKDEE